MGTRILPAGKVNSGAGNFGAEIAGRARGRGRAIGRRAGGTGFTYVTVLAAVVVTGIVVEAARLTTWRLVQADREAELLFRGAAYRRAIRSYYEAGVELGVKSFPRALENLLEDPRFPHRRHLRALYPDPMAEDEEGEWTLIRAPDGGIAGVASRGHGEPLRKANFEKPFENFAGAASYADWIFEYRPPPAASIPKPSSAS